MVIFGRTCVSESDLKSYYWSAAKELDRNISDELAQASLCQSAAKCSVSVSEGETREHAQSERIDQLEQALEQSLTSLNELRQKLKDQQILETQLAVTEEIANLQQKAITQLKRQLAQQQQSLDVQIPKTQRTQFFQFFQDFLRGVKTLAQTQQPELEYLKSPANQNRVLPRATQNWLGQKLPEQHMCLAQQQKLELESEILSPNPLLVSLVTQLTEASGQVESLWQQLSERTAALTQCSVEIEKSQIWALEQGTTIALLKQNLATNQLKVEALETDLAQQRLPQARFKHAYLELEREYDQALARITQLQQIIVALQEQVLQQSQQAGEYEAAVQYWKNQYLESLNLVLQLKEVLGQLLPDSADESALLEAVQSLVAAKAKKPVRKQPPLPLKNQPIQLDLPTFQPYLGQSQY